MSASGDAPAASATKPAEMTYAEAADLAVVRDFVRTGAAGLGLPADRADLLVIAVSELATNTLQHTGGGGLVRVWAEPGRLCCEVVDQGAPREFGRSMPAAHEPRGRGLAIVERLCDEVTVVGGADGTHVRMGFFL